MVFSLLMISLLIILQCCGFCDAQEHVETNCNEQGNCNEVTDCIGTYHELDLYVRGNSTLKEKLNRGFFMTGKIPSEFVRITYNYEVSYDANCSSRQSKFFWSDNFLYLIGPRPLLYFTLFAVEVPEGSITIDLPCLCRDAYTNLLSRLTYMVGNNVTHVQVFVI